MAWAVFSEARREIEEVEERGKGECEERKKVQTRC